MTASSTAPHSYFKTSRRLSMAAFVVALLATAATATTANQNKFSCKEDFGKDFLAAPTEASCSAVTAKLNSILSTCPFTSGTLGCIAGETAEDVSVISQVSGACVRACVSACVCVCVSACVCVCVRAFKDVVYCTQAHTCHAISQACASFTHPPSLSNLTYPNFHAIYIYIYIITFPRFNRCVHML